MKAKIYLEVELPEPKGKFTGGEIYYFINSHLFGGLVQSNNPFNGEIKKISMHVKTDYEK